MTEFVLRQGWPLLASVTVKSLFGLLLAGLCSLATRRLSAAARHLVWRVAITGLLLLPLFSCTPGIWHIPLGPRADFVTADAPVITHSTDPPRTDDEKRVGKEAPKTTVVPSYIPSVPAASLTSGWYGFAWQQCVCCLWVVGAAVCLLPCLFGLLGVARLARRSEAVTRGPLAELKITLARELGVTQPIRLLLGDVTTPMTWGGLRPVILLPRNADEWPEGRLRAVLLHELAHVSREDWIAQINSNVACALYWFNPLIWLVARQARLEGERACDDRVLLAGMSAPDYAGYLLDVARSVRDSPLRSALPMIQPGTLATRVREILASKRERSVVGKGMNNVLTMFLLTPMIFSPLLDFAVPMPADRNVWLDQPSYLIIGQSNAATASLQSLQAELHASTTFTYRVEGFRTVSTITLQRPNLARIETTGPSGSTCVSDGSHYQIAEHDGSPPITLSVSWNGNDIMGDDESLPFVQYFFQPDFHRLGSDLIDREDAVLPLGSFSRPIPVSARCLGVSRWQGAFYQVVEFTRDASSRYPAFKNVTTVYVGADHLIHRIVGRAYFSEGTRTDDVWLTNLRLNQASPRADFRLPAKTL